MTATQDLSHLFQLGTDAYEQGHYQQAVEKLTPLLRCESPSYRIKGAIALVNAYIGLANWPAARDLCRKLETSRKPQLKKWAQETLRKIERLAAAEDSAQVSPAESAPNADENISGFQPLDASEPKSMAWPSNSSPDLSGFQALSPETPTVAQSTSTPTAKPEPIAPEPVVQRQDKTPNQADPSPSAQAASSSSGMTLGQGTRLRQGRRLGQMKRGRLIVAQVVSAIAFVGFFYYGPRQILFGIDAFLIFLDGLMPFWVRMLPYQLYEYMWPVGIGLGLTFFLSPWLWDGWLRWVYKATVLPADILRTKSPEATSLMAQLRQKRRWPLPKLRLLPTDTPLIFSCGWLPRNARLVISQGAIDQLDAETLAALIAYEISGWRGFTWPMLSAQGWILQVLHQLYWQSALWANRRGGVLVWLGGIVSCVCYSLFYLLRIPGLWLARLRSFYGDRAATSLTGNPNGLARGLIQLSFGMGEAIVQHSYTPPLLESLCLQLPVAPDMDRHFWYGQLPLSELFSWDVENPLGPWMGLLNSHPSLGERLQLLMAYARHWQLTPEIVLASPAKRQRRLTASQWKRLVSQGAPWAGLLLGLGSALLLWGLGQLSIWFGWRLFDWMMGDDSLLRGLALLGFSAGTIVRINRFFPDLQAAVAMSSSGEQWVSAPAHLPIDCLPAKLKGTLEGRPGVANWLGQDYWIAAPTAWYRLHFFTGVLGPLGNAGRQKPLIQARQQPVQLLGWLRRGSALWIDVDRMQTQRGKVYRANHPVFSVSWGAIAAGYGLWLLFGF